MDPAAVAVWKSGKHWTIARPAQGFPGVPAAWFCSLEDSREQAGDGQVPRHGYIFSRAIAQPVACRVKILHIDLQVAILEAAVFGAFPAAQGIGWSLEAGISFGLKAGFKRSTSKHRVWIAEGKEGHISPLDLGSTVFEDSGSFGQPPERIYT